MTPDGFGECARPSAPCTHHRDAGGAEAEAEAVARGNTGGNTSERKSAFYSRSRAHERPRALSSVVPPRVPRHPSEATRERRESRHFGRQCVVRRAREKKRGKSASWSPRQRSRAAGTLKRRVEMAIARRSIFAAKIVRQPEGFPFFFVRVPITRGIGRPGNFRFRLSRLWMALPEIGRRVLSHPRETVTKPLETAGSSAHNRTRRARHTRVRAILPLPRRHL